MIKKTYVDIDVVTMAKKRVKNIFSSASKIVLSTSGGKDSACVSEIIYQLCMTGEIDKSKLYVDFIDEEAIYPCVEKCVKEWRLKWLGIGVPFNWYCIPCRHYSCLNQLTQDESFILWEPNKEWIREMPKFAIKNHPLLRPYKDTYQDFLTRKYDAEGSVRIDGVRASESLQRKIYIAGSKDVMVQHPIYDWTDNDVWLFIRNNNITIPDAYIYMYQVGLGKKDMRISQFFSIDTVKSLVKMCEFYPNLFNKICKREPNAYMVTLYFDTELYRRMKTKKEKGNIVEQDWKAKCYEYINDDSKWTTEKKQKERKDYRKLLLNNSFYMGKKEYKRLYETLIAGDPKRRSRRAILQDVVVNKWENRK